MANIGFASTRDAARVARATKKTEQADPRTRDGGRWGSSPVPQPVKIIAAAGGAGWYTAKIWNPPASTIAVTAALTSTALGSAGIDCYYGNLTEQGKSTHDLMDSHNTDTKLFFGFRWGTAADGKPIYLSSGFFPEDCPAP